MANDCLIMNLKGEVNNISLPKMNEIKFFHSDDSMTNTLSVQAIHQYGNIEFRATGNAYLYKSNGTEFLGDIPNCQEVSFQNTSYKEFKVKGEGYVFIKIAAYIQNLLLGDPKNTFTLINLKRAKNTLKQFNMNNATINDSIDYFSDFTALTDVTLSKAPTYDIGIFGNKTDLVQFFIGKGGTGSLESFVEKQLSSGRTSGSISTNIYNSNVTLNGVTGASNARHTITFNSATNVTISFNSATVATYDNGTWTYS